jgi:hypothetical protein
MIDTIVSSVAFFPWVSIAEALTVDTVRLIPYQRGVLPGTLTGVSQQDLDDVLAAYAISPLRAVDRATLLEVGSWTSGDNAANIVDQLFRVKELISFAAIAKRKLFSAREYVNFHTYQLVVQNFSSGSSGTFSFTSRRRDGKVHHLWSTEEFAFHMPHEVISNAKASMDLELLHSMLAADKQSRLPLGAIESFNRANTDSSDVTEESELVMMKCSFEWLFDIGVSSNDFCKAFAAHIPRGEWLGNSDTPVSVRWREARPRATTLLDAWAREFCAIRGSFAHGMNRKADHYVWSPAAHLAFASMIFPLLLKQKLATDGFGSLAERDDIELRSAEAFLTCDPMDSAHFVVEATHPWEEIRTEVVIGEVLRRQLASSYQIIEARER